MKTMETKDVKKLWDIPSMEDYLPRVFSLLLYDVGDKTVAYELRLPNRHRISIEIITESKLIHGRMDLAEMISHYDIHFLQFTEYNDLLDPVSSYFYRPLVKDEDKNFI